MKVMQVDYQKEPTAEIKAFNGFKYYVNIKHSGYFFSVYMVLSENEMREEEIKSATVSKLYFDRPKSIGTEYKINIRNVTNCKKYN